MSVPHQDTIDCRCSDCELRRTSLDDVLADDDPAYLAYLSERDCPHHGTTTIVDDGESPSMYAGTDSWERWACGCTVTWDPFTGRESVRPAR